MSSLLTIRRTRIAIVLLVVGIGVALIAPHVEAKPMRSVATVYQDEYISVNAGIIEAGSKAIHLGDALSLAIQVMFDPQQVRIENLNEDVFQRAFAGVPSIRLYAPVEVTTQTETGDRVRLTGIWRFQILDCAEDLTSCAGAKTYPLPIMTISYQLTGGADNTSDSRSARFRPWPGTIAVAPAISIGVEGKSELNDVLPGGAHAQPESVERPASVTPMLLISGALLFGAGFIAATQKRHPGQLVARSHVANSRWERTLVYLGDDSIADDEWADALRRSVTWYCVDELGQNPYAWLGAAASDAGSSDPATASWRQFFIDVLQQHGIDRQKRSEYREKFLRLSGRIGSGNANGSPA